MERKALTLDEISVLTKSKLIGDPQHVITNVADLDHASPKDASFLSNPRYRQNMVKSKAGVIFVSQHLDDGRNYLITDDPSKAFQQLVDTFFPPKKFPSAFIGIHPTATIHPSAQIASGVSIGPNAVIDEGVKIGENTFIFAGVYIGCYSEIGSQCLLYPHVVIRENCILGNRVIIQPGAIIGSCGFGYITNSLGHHVKLNQVGNVIIEDDVEIGANTTIDRSRFKSTIIGRGSKIDNLVQIAHGVELGTDNMIVAQVGISGSTTTGKHVVLGGQVGVVGHVHLDDLVMVAAQSGVSKSLPEGKYSGTPAIPIEEHNRNYVLLRNIDKFITETKSRLRHLESDQAR